MRAGLDFCSQRYIAAGRYCQQSYDRSLSAIDTARRSPNKGQRPMLEDRLAAGRPMLYSSVR